MEGSRGQRARGHKGKSREEQQGEQGGRGGAPGLGAGSARSAGGASPAVWMSPPWSPRRPCSSSWTGDPDPALSALVEDSGSSGSTCEFGGNTGERSLKVHGTHDNRIPADLAEAAPAFASVRGNRIFAAAWESAL